MSRGKISFGKIGFSLQNTGQSSAKSDNESRAKDNENEGGFGSFGKSKSNEIIDLLKIEKEEEKTEKDDKGKMVEKVNCIAFF